MRDDFVTVSEFDVTLAEPIAVTGSNDETCRKQMCSGDVQHPRPRLSFEVRGNADILV